MVAAASAPASRPASRGPAKPATPTRQARAPAPKAAKPAPKGSDAASRSELEALRREVAALRSKEGGGWIPVDPTPPGRGPPRPPAAGPGTPARPKTDLEVRVGYHVAAGAGIILFVLGAVFFFRTAIEEGWLDPGARVALGIVTGLVFWGGGIAIDKTLRLNVYGQLLSVGGALLTYFAIFAGHFFEEYQEATGWNLELASILLGIVALGVAGDAFLRRSQPIAGGAVALMVTTALASGDFASFSVFYTVFLTIAIIAAAGLRQWPAISLSALPVAFLILALHLSNDVDGELILIGDLLLIGVAAVTGFLARDDPLEIGAQSVLQILAFIGGWVIALFSLESMSERAFDQASGFVTLGLAVVALGLTAVPAVKAVRLGWAIGGIFLAVAWPLVHFEGEITTPILWAVMAGALASITAVSKGLLFRISALVVSAVLVIRLLSVEAFDLESEALGAGLGLLVFAIAVAGVAMGWVLHLVRPGIPGLAWTHLALALGLPLVYMAAALDGGAISIAWAVEAVLVLLAGALSRVQELRWIGLGLFVPVLVRILAIDLAGVDPVWRVLTLLVTGLILLGVSLLYAGVFRRQQDAP